MANECLKLIDDAAKGVLSDDEISTIVEAMERIKAERGASNKLGSIERELFDEAGKLLEEVEIAAKIEKRNRLMNIVKEGQLFRKSVAAAEQLNDPSLGLEADMVGINSKLEGGRDSVAINAHALEMQYMGGMVADLKAADLHGVYSRGDLDKEINAELRDIQLKKPTGTATKSADAKKIAKVIHKYQKAAVRRENRAGSWIRELEGRGVGQSHNRRKMERETAIVWKADVNNILDWDRMKVPLDERNDFLQSAYEAMTTGTRKDAPGAQTDLQFAFTGPGNLAKKASSHRVLHFKTADDWFEYNEKYGKLNFRESVANDLRMAAMNTALMDKFGTNPQAMFDKVRDRLKKKYRSDPKMHRRLERKTLDWFMAELDGSANFADNETLAAFGANFRAIQSMAKLGGAFISSIVDVAAAASERRFQGRSLLDSHLDALKVVFEGVAPGERRHTAELLGIGIGGLQGGVMARFASQDELTGKMSKLMGAYFKLNLLQPWTDGVKRGVGLMMSRDLAVMSAKGWDALDPRTRRNLAQYGMDAAKWEVAKLAVVDGPDGLKYMIPSEIQNASLPGRKGQALKDEVQKIMSGYITDRVEFASPTPGAKERALIRGGSTKGTAWGEAVRFLMQFKAFPITVISRVQGRDIYSGGAKSLGDAFMKGEGDLLGLATYIAGSGVLGYFALQAKEAAKGREFRENSPGLFISAMLQGGGLGLYGDFLLGEANRFGGTPIDTAAGPGIGIVLGKGGVVDITQRMIHGVADGDAPDVGAALLKLAQSNIPGANLFYTKAAMDYLVFYRLQEMANPGYLKRMERRMKKENNQTFFFPPSEAVR